MSTQTLRHECVLPRPRPCGGWALTVPVAGVLRLYVLTKHLAEIRGGAFVGLAGWNEVEEFIHFDYWQRACYARGGFLGSDVFDEAIMLLYVTLQSVWSER